MPRRLEEQVAFMGKNPEVGVLGGAFELITDSGEVIDIVRHPLEDSQIRSAMFRYNPICHSSVILRKDFVLASGGYRGAFEPSEDYDLWLRMSERSRLANLHNVLVRYRVHAKQLSVRKLEHQRLCVLAASTAAAFRKQGKPDPFSGIEQITPELLRKLGVTKAEIQDCLQASPRSSVIDSIRGAFRVRLWHPLLNLTRPIRHALGLRQKSVKATDKQKVLLRNGLRDAAWIETGTYLGDTTSVLSKVAKIVYSIEPEPTLFSKAEQRFSNARNVKIIKGLSEDVFPDLLPALTGNICF